jgi:hypothetical protein
MPVGAAVDTDESGILCIAVVCCESQRRFVIPLLDTLHVPGLRLTLWSVAAFNVCGHAITFD